MCWLNLLLGIGALKGEGATLSRREATTLTPNHYYFRVSLHWPVQRDGGSLIPILYVGWCIKLIGRVASNVVRGCGLRSTTHNFPGIIYYCFIATWRNLVVVS